MFTRREFLAGTIAGIVSTLTPKIDVNTQLQNENEPYRTEYGPIKLTIDQNADIELRDRLENSVRQMYGLLSTFTPFIESATGDVNVIGYTSNQFAINNLQSNDYVQTYGESYFLEQSMIRENNELAVNLSDQLWRQHLNNKDEFELSTFFGTYSIGLRGVSRELAFAMLGSFGEAWGYSITNYPYWFAEGTAMILAFLSTNVEAAMGTVLGATNFTDATTTLLSDLESIESVFNNGIHTQEKCFIAVSRIMFLSEKKTVEPLLQMLADMGQGISFEEALLKQTGKSIEEFYQYVEENMRYENAGDPTEPILPNIGNSGRV